MASPCPRHRNVGDAKPQTKYFFRCCASTSSVCEECVKEQDDIKTEAEGLQDKAEVGEVKRKDIPVKLELPTPEVTPRTVNSVTPRSHNDKGEHEKEDAITRGTSSTEGPSSDQTVNERSSHCQKSSTSSNRPTYIWDFSVFLDKWRPKSVAARSINIVFCNGVQYEGEMREGVPCGWGVVHLLDGVVYEGEWSTRGLIHGRGALRLPNGNAYWGSWADSHKHGRGSFGWADGSRHDGLYIAGKRCGMGRIRYASGAIYEGGFLNDARHGQGCLSLPNGSFYRGTWNEDERKGHGLFVEPGKQRYVGDWENGVRSGKGKLTDTGPAGGGGWYEGDFLDGLPHGHGVMNHGGMTFEGPVEQGIWTGGGWLELSPGGDRFEGMWEGGLPRGQGMWYYTKQEGQQTECSFEEGCKQRAG